MPSLGVLIQLSETWGWAHSNEKVTSENGSAVTSLGECLGYLFGPGKALEEVE